MKKLLLSLSTFTLLASSISADMLRIEAGAGVWQQTPSGTITRTDSDGALKLDGTYKSKEVESNEAYVWLLIKHPLPIIPNLRLEYVSLYDEGTTTGSVNGWDIPRGLAAPTTIDMKQYDIIPYYNILDNLFWTTIDLGIDAKIVQSDINVSPVTGFAGYQTTDTSVIPLVYVRGRVEVPATGLAFESDIKAITDGTSSYYDFRAKVDYTFDLSGIKPGIEIGYRIQKLRFDDGVKTQADIQYDGFYAGAMVRF